MPSFSERKAEAALAAALVHDVGHGPFSHAFETVGKKFDLTLAQHELVSDALIRDSEISAVLNDFSGGFSADVAAIIKAKGPRRIYDTVVSSQFDADRLDYLRRDRLMAGSKHGGIDYDWLVANLEIVEIPFGVDEIKLGNVTTLAVGPKAISAAEAYVLGLFQLYPTIYFHKTTRGVEKIFHSLISRVFELVLDGSVVETGLPENHPIVVFVKNPNQIDAAQELDDTVIWGALPLMKAANDKLCSEFAIRLLERRLYKVVDVRKVIRVKLVSKHGLVDEDHVDRVAAKALEKIELWMKTKGDRVLLDTGTRSPYKSFEESKGPLNPILVKDPSGDVIDLSVVSPVVAAIRDFSFVRVYYDPDKEGLFAELIKVIEGEC